MENECDGRVLRGRPMVAPTVKRLQIVRNGALRSYPRAPSLALRAIHLVLRLRRVNHMCSSTVPDTANMLRNIRKKKSSAVLLFGAVAGLRSAPDYEIKGNGS